MLTVMTDPDLHEAWEQVHANTPLGWYVGRPGYEERYDQWSMYASDPSEKAVVGKRSREWTAIGRTEVEYVESMAYCLAELNEGRWPK
jgi:hypothetical protein